MRDPLAFPERGDQRAVWLFSLDVAPDELSHWSPPQSLTDATLDWPMLAALGVDQLDAAHVEVFDVEDLAGVGLASYLSDAHGMSLDGDAPRLARIKGSIALVFATALPDAPGHLMPTPPLRFVARYENPFDLSPAMPADPMARGAILQNTPSTPLQFPWRIMTLTAAALLAFTLILWSLL